MSGVGYLTVLNQSSRDRYNNIKGKDGHRWLIMLSQESLDLFVSSWKDISWIVLVMEEFVGTSSSNQEAEIIAPG